MIKFTLKNARLLIILALGAFMALSVSTATAFADGVRGHGNQGEHRSYSKHKQPIIYYNVGHRGDRDRKRNYSYNPQKRHGHDHWRYERRGRHYNAFEHRGRHHPRRLHRPARAGGLRFGIGGGSIRIILGGNRRHSFW